MERFSSFPNFTDKFPLDYKLVQEGFETAAAAISEPSEKDLSEGLVIRMAVSEYDLKDVFRLRYQVYCLERGFEKVEDYPEGFESDDYDPYSLHFVAYTQDKPVGTVRLILPGPLEFPIERHCGVDVGSICRGDTRVAEISRLAVSSDALKGSSIGKSVVTVRLIEELFRADKLHGLGIRHVFAAMSRSLERRLKRCGISFMPAGEPVHYHGIRTPFYTSPDEVLKMFMKGGGNPLVGRMATAEGER